jgi:hypothetical protein
MKVPTGDHNIPVHIREAKRIWQMIQAKISMSNMQILQGIESGVASINGGNPNQQTTTNLTDQLTGTKMPWLSPSTALSEFAAMNKNSDNREMNGSG